MGNLFDYLRWRGDLSLNTVPVTPVDALIFSTLSYLNFEGIVPRNMQNPIPLHVAADAFLSLADALDRVRAKSDLQLLRAAADSPRLRNTRLAFYRSKLIPEEETQFAATAFLLDDGSAFLAFRGTDYSLVGWKEDFNMSFQDSVPAQREAVAYVAELAENYPVLLRLGGHSKGGNLSVYAAAKASPNIQKRILEIYNLDGPGFTETMMQDAGYLAIVPKIKTYIPESSIIGMLLEQRNDYHVIKSRQLGLLQHEPYSWEIQAGDFEHTEEISKGTRFADKAITNWLRDMTPEERGAFVDATYQLLSASGASSVGELLHPKNILAFFKALNTNEESRKLLTVEMVEFLKAAYASLPKNEKNKDGNT